MKFQNRFTSFALQFLVVSAFFTFFSNSAYSQVQVGVTINSGNSTTTCNDLFSGPDPRWSVRVDAGLFVTYSNNNSDNCFEAYPNLQWAFPFDCQEDLPTTLMICFRAFENDGIGSCNIDESCLEEICQNFIVPNAGSVATYTLSLPNGGSSGGQVEFSIGAIGSVFESLNDEICNAENMGTLPSGGTLGVASDGGFNNLCSTNTNEVSPSDDGAWVNEQGVWMEFTTSATPGYELLIEALSDPLNIGNPMNIELAVYESDDGTCNGNLTFMESSFFSGDFNESMTMTCPEPNTTYFILVDGNDFDLEGEGHFGLQISDNGAVAAPDRKCDAYDLGLIPIGGNSMVAQVHNECADNIGDPFNSEFVSQKSVWFTFQAPPSGSVLIEALSYDGAPWNNGIGAQIGVYRSFNNTCSGFFFEVESSFTSADEDETLALSCLNPGDNYWILIDGSGSNTTGVFDMVVTDLENYPPETTNDTTVCFGETVQVGNATYSNSGNYTYVFNMPDGCDSTVYTNLTIADLLEVQAEQVTLASGPTSADGSVTATPMGGTGPFTFVWSNGVNTQLNENIPPGNYCVTVTDAIGCTAEDCVDLEYSLISASSSGDALLCFGDMDGKISFSAQDGTQPYMYAYSNGDASITGNGMINTDGELIEINNLPAGIYQIDIEDAAGNTTFTTATITEPAEIIFNQDYTLCFGESIVIGNTIYDASGTIAETITASNGCDSIVTGLLTILPDPSNSIVSTICFGENMMIGNSTYTISGNYIDTLQNADGCDSIISTNLTVLDEITVTITVDVLPTGFDLTDGAATATASGGAGGFTFAWSDGQTTSTATNLAGGTDYCVVATDANGCTQTVCETILYQPNIAFALSDTLDCFGNTNGQITLAVANGKGDYNYAWENLDDGTTGNGTITGNFGTANITNLSKGNYSILVSDEFVSTVVLAEVIEPLPLLVQNITGQNVTCQGDCNGSVTITPSGGTAPYTYSWSGGISPVPDPTNLCATDYTVTVTDANNCTSTLTINIPEPTPFSVAINEMESIECGGDTNGILNAIPTGGTGTDYTFAWSNNDSDSFAGELGSGNYTVTATDAVGCTTTASYFLNEPTPVNFDLTITDVDCWSGLNSGSVDLENITGGTAPYVYAIGQQNTFNSFPSFNQLTAGSYQVYVQDANGCVFNDQAIVNLPQEIELELGDDFEINLGETVELQALNNSDNALIEWTNDTCHNCPTLEVTPINTTAYEVSVLDTITGCSDSDIIYVYVNKVRKVFIPNAFSPDGDGANDYLTIFADSRSVQTIQNFRVFNRWGAMVFERKNLIPNEEAEGWNGFFNGKKMQSGVYIYSVEIQFIDGQTELFRGDVTLME